MPNTVSLHRILATTPEKIYRAFVEPDAIAQWIPPNGFTCTVHQLEPKVGGSHRMSFRNFTTGQGHSFGGQYLELARNERLRYTDKFDDPNLPGEIRVTVTLKKVSVGTELTIVQENLKVNIAIINNGFLGMVRQWQEFFYERNYQATPLLNPDFAKLAEAYGIRSATVTQRSEVVPTVRDARQHSGPMLINFKVEQEDTVYPMVAAGASLHEMIRRPSPIVETAADE